MARKRKAKARRQVDKWKLKKWFDVIPIDDVFPKEAIAQVVATEPEKLPGRIVRVPLNMLNGKATPLAFYTTVKFRIKEAKEKEAHAYVNGHEVAMSYLRSLARRRRTVMHDVIKVKTKDGKEVAVKTMVVTRAKVSNVVKKNLRKTLWEKVKAFGEKRDYAQLMKEILDEGLSREIYAALNPINPIEHVVVKKTELMEELA